MLLVKQALGDLAQFRQFIVQKYRLTSANKWVSFGGSYPGMLAGWFRLNYPHLVVAAVASSAPVTSQMNMQVCYRYTLLCLQIYIFSIYLLPVACINETGLQ
jgi:pimeloyl-ACP methyl ester carboxylesterase